MKFRGRVLTESDEKKLIGLNWHLHQINQKSFLTETSCEWTCQVIPRPQICSYASCKNDASYTYIILKYSERQLSEKTEISQSGFSRPESCPVQKSKVTFLRQLFSLETALAIHENEFISLQKAYGVVKSQWNKKCVARCLPGRLYNFQYFLVAGLYVYLSLYVATRTVINLFPWRRLVCDIFYRNHIESTV